MTDCAEISRKRRKKRSVAVYSATKGKARREKGLEVSDIFDHTGPARDNEEFLVRGEKLQRHHPGQEMGRSARGSAQFFEDQCLHTR